MAADFTLETMIVTNATTYTGDAPDLAQIAAIEFTPHDSPMTMAPTPEDWATVSYQLHTALVMAAAVLPKSREDLQDILTGGDADGLLESMVAMLKAAGERFGEFQAACEAAEARVYVAAAGVVAKSPADA